MLASPSLAGDLLAAADPVVFARKAGLEPEMWQADFLRSQAAQRILLCSRQAGKSTITAAAAVHQAVYTSDSLVLVVAPAMRQAREAYKKMVALYAGAGEPVRTETQTKLELQLINGSRIVVIPDKEGTVRGYSNVALVIVDEAAWVSDDSYMALRPMLAVSQGKLVLLSTPHGKRGFFHAEWAEGGPDWHRTKVTAHEVAHIDPGWLAAERRKVPARVFAAEYLCTFTELEDAVFSYDDIRAALNPNLRPVLTEPLFPTGGTL
jgi:hypothetical protein